MKKSSTQSGILKTVEKKESPAGTNPPSGANSFPD
jgi:hypothetical protein